VRVIRARQTGSRAGDGGHPRCIGRTSGNPCALFPIGALLSVPSCLLCCECARNRVV
jgi:hypothetical protein